MLLNSCIEQSKETLRNTYRKTVLSKSENISNHCPAWHGVIQEKIGQLNNNSVCSLFRNAVLCLFSSIVFNMPVILFTKIYCTINFKVCIEVYVVLHFTKVLVIYSNMWVWCECDAVSYLIMHPNFYCSHWVWVCYLCVEGEYEQQFILTSNILVSVLSDYDKNEEHKADAMKLKANFLTLCHMTAAVQEIKWILLSWARHVPWTSAFNISHSLC